MSQHAVVLQPLESFRVKWLFLSIGGSYNQKLSVGDAS